MVVKLSLAEVLLDEYDRTTPESRTAQQAFQSIVRMTQDIKNESPIQAALMLYKARALLRLGLASAAKDTLTVALRRKKDRSAELLHALRYERGLVYEAMGQRDRARADFEKIYAEAPDYEDVGKRVGL